MLPREITRAMFLLARHELIRIYITESFSTASLSYIRGGLCREHTRFEKRRDSRLPRESSPPFFFVARCIFLADP